MRASGTLNAVDPSQPDLGLIVFARYPKVGAVKTRLAAGVGAIEATELYKSFVSSTLRECLRCSKAKAYLALAAPTEDRLLHEWLSENAPPTSFRIIQQSASPDLGIRMLQAMQHAMQAGAAKVVLVGSDIPDLDAGILMNAFRALDRHEIVFGPARDGGFYLVGARQLHQHLFRGLTWSTPEVLRDAVRQAEQCGLHVAAKDTLPCLRDIDTSEDLQHWLHEAGNKSGQQQMRELAQAALSRRVIPKPAD
ncbi:hypothetical protein WJX74_002402 [Apatococcus lobatus]|uniref:Glycosyltransferase n=2 Tax=Apatococcus TaxID=904362 RepID=A0AAW1T4X2_9CHLO